MKFREYPKSKIKQGEGMTEMATCRNCAQQGDCMIGRGPRTKFLSEVKDEPHKLSQSV